VNISETDFIEKPATIAVCITLPGIILIDIFNDVANNLMVLLHWKIPHKNCLVKTVV